MTETRVPAGVPTGGQFAATHRTESTVTLAPPPLNEVQQAVRSNVWNTARDLHPFEVDRVEAISEDEARRRMREDLPLMSDEDFDHHFAEVTDAARRSSELANSPHDPSMFDASYYINGHELADFPAEDDDDPEGSGYDVDAWREKLIEEWDLEAYAAAGRMARHA